MESPKGTMPMTADSGASTRERLQRAALELFAERGFDGASMADLADRIGIAKPSLYNYYRSKEELLLDLLEQAIARWLNECVPAFDAEAALETQLHRYFHKVLEFLRVHPHEVVLYHLATLHLQGEVAERAHRLFEQAEARIEQTFERSFQAARARGELGQQVDSSLFRDFLGVFFRGLLLVHCPAARKGGSLQHSPEELWPLLHRALFGRLPQGEPPR